MKSLGLGLLLLLVLFTRGSGQQKLLSSQSVNADLSDRITRLEVELESLKPLPQLVYDLKTQIVALQGKLDNLDTKLNIVMGILVAIALPVLGEVVKRISERVAPPPPPAAGSDSRTMELLEKLVREKSAPTPGAITASGATGAGA